MYSNNHDGTQQVSADVPAKKFRRPLQGIVLVSLAALILIAVSSAFADSTSEELEGGDSIQITCDGEHLEVLPESRTRVEVVCVGDNNNPPEPEPTSEPNPPEPEPTSEPNPPEPEPTSEPNPPEPDPTPEPDPPTDASSPFGVYPNCIAPAVGLETHSWWHENGETSPRHVHIATCLPNARAVDDGTTFSGDMDAVLRVMSFNNPSDIEWVRYQWRGNTQETRSIDGHCQNSPDEFKECTWYFDFNIDTGAANGGLDELRLSPNIKHNDLGTRQFPTLNYQIRTGNGGNYRNSEEPIARSWYTGLSYARVQWSNYMDLFNGRYDISVPIVSGTIDIDVRHTKSDGTCRTSEGYVDPPFHAFHAGNASQPVPFYQEDGCFDGNQSLDTTTLSNGLHTIYLQTRVGDGRGFNASAMAFQINVQN